MEKIKKVTEIEQLDDLLALYIAEENVKRAKTECAYREKVLELLKGAQMKREKLAEEMQEDDPFPAQWLDGSQESCVRLARRILNKLPKLNSPKETLYVEISPSYLGGCNLTLRYINIINKDGGVANCELTAKDEPEEQARKIDHWMKRVEVEMAEAQEIMRKEADNE